MQFNLRRWSRLGVCGVAALGLLLPGCKTTTATIPGDGANTTATPVNQPLPTGPAVAPITAISSDGLDAERIQRSLVRLLVTKQTPNIQEPWNPGIINQAVGTGFVIAGNRILTNAHVASDAKDIVAQREGVTRVYRARVLSIANDCDLALMTVDDPAFFANVPALEFGGLPKLDTTVTAFGYPIGGSRMSITRGVVSRIDFITYSHSGMDQHLAVQVDAAINPGNSGGPVLQGGLVVGVAFQAFSGAVAQNTGYIIPTPVVLRYLEDVKKDGKYQGYVELAVDTLNLQNASYRKFLGLPNDDRGVLVTRVLQCGSGAGALLQGDILLSIDGHPISSDGRIMLDGGLVRLEEIAERKFSGDVVTFQGLRAGKPLTAKVTLKDAKPFTIFSRQYDADPKFVLFAGMLFQRMSGNLLSSYGTRNHEILNQFEHFVTDELYLKRPEVVIFTNVLPDEINSGLQSLEMNVVESVNDQPIGSLKDLSVALKQPAERYIIRLVRHGRPIVIEAAQLAAARQRIKDNYQISVEENVD